MSNLGPTSTKPDFHSVEELIELVRSGEMRVPRFQRPYVWSPDDMSRLFDSVRRGYPIGSLLVWQTNRTDITSLNDVGPISVATAGPSLKSYVVDGHQRLATLVGVLGLPENYPRSRPDEWRWWIAYDLRHESFVHLRPSQTDIPLHLILLRDLLRTVSFARRTRDILGSQQYTESEAEVLIDRADALQRAIRDYRIPYTLMRSGSLDDAVTIFSRVNQRGRDMTADQMVSALTFRDKGEGDFDLASTIDEIIGEVRGLDFGDVERRIILQVVLAMTGLDFTRTSYETLVDRSTHSAMRPAVEESKKAVLNSVHFLRDCVGVKTSRLLPYASILLMLAIFFGEICRQGRVVSEDETRILRKWFWAVSFNGWFAGANTTDMRQAAEALKGFAIEGRNSVLGHTLEALFLSKPLRPFPETFDRRSARIRASLLVQINAGQPLDPRSGNPVDGAEIFTQEATRDIPYFFPNLRRPLVSSPANRVILPGGYNRSARGYFLALEGSSLLERVLESHFISAAAFDALKNEDAEAFLSHRESDLLVAEGTFLRALGLGFDPMAERSGEEFDADE